ncbi:MAG: His/Gly/Thr/Pro-type tRNA ligase C-terminal domain-containing protein, partial [Candidatus Thiodiazotropha taylori]
GGGGFKSQLKRAEKSQARFALILGEDELQKQQIILKPLRGGEQRQIGISELESTLAEIVAG